MAVARCAGLSSGALSGAVTLSGRRAPTQGNFYSSPSFGGLALIFLIHYNLDGVNIYLSLEF